MILLEKAGAYAEKNTDKEAETDNEEVLELEDPNSQIRHFNEVIDTTPNLVNCDIYVDNGISGRFLNRREAFLQMLTVRNTDR